MKIVSSFAPNRYPFPSPSPAEQAERRDGMAEKREKGKLT
jgi:hypothetical protein